MKQSWRTRSAAVAAIFWLALTTGVTPARAQMKVSEMAGAKDPSVISRYAGSVLQDMADENFASLRIPAGPGRYVSNKLAFEKSIDAEGRLAAYFYVQPAASTALEVYRNYQSALQKAGFTTLYSCEMQACDQALIKEIYANEVVRPRQWRGKANPGSAIQRDVRFISAQGKRDGSDVYLMVYVAEPKSTWQAPTSVVLVLEPNPVDTGKVVVDTAALQRGLQEDGKIALYGLYFDTGKAEVKPESRPQLAEMARLLQAEKSLKVFIVGHTDNQGTLQGNLTLSQRRAEAVVAALVADHQVDAARLGAKGVASFAPVSSNAAEAGRAKNRRVELVVQ